MFKRYKIITAFVVALLFAPLPVFADSTAFDLVISAGMPVIGAGSSDLTTTGNVFFVDGGSANRADSADHGSYTKPYTTVDYAAGRQTASNGDIVFIAPGHTEDVASANDIISGVTDVKYIGLGVGRNRPTLTWTTATSTWLTTASEITFENIIFDMTGFNSGVTSGMDINSPGISFINCEFLISDSTSGVTYAINAASDNADRLKVINCKFTGVATVSSGVSAAIYFGSNTPDDVQIIGNTFQGYFLYSPIYKTGTLTNYVERDNLFVDAYVGTRTDHGLKVSRVPKQSDNGKVIVDVDFSSSSWNRPGYPCTHEIFTVNGLNRIKVMAEVESGVSDPVIAGGSAVIYVGYSGASDFLWRGTVLNDLDDGEIWFYGNPTTAVAYNQNNYQGAASGTTTASIFKEFVSNDTDIGYAISGSTPTSGIIRFHIEYEPLEPGAYVEASSGVTL